MIYIELQQYRVRFKNGFTLHQLNWQLQQGQHWVVTGPNGAGKSALTALLAPFTEEDGITVLQGEKYSTLPEIALVSTEQQKRWLQQERLLFDGNQLDNPEQGTTVAELLQHNTEPPLLQQLLQQFDMEKLLSRPFRLLSTGELRKLELIKALTALPQILILDEPFAGLDQASVLELKALLDAVSQRCMLIVVLSRLADIPAFITHLAYMQQGRLILQLPHTQEQLKQLGQLLHLKEEVTQLPPAPSEQAVPALPVQQPLVRLKNISVRYGERLIFEKLDWTILPGQHWKLSGPNGCGKSSLLALITGDNPQCYNNNIFVFGFQRGNGESIWQIKQYIGYVSSALQQDYRVRSSIRDTLLSGFFDSIGLYQKATPVQQQVVEQWLDLLALKDRQYQVFADLSFGDQRLVLIARAMIKQPALLILDEPCLGLDEINRQKILALTELICQHGNSTVLYVSHHAADIIAGITHHLDLTEFSANQKIKLKKY